MEHIYAQFVKEILPALKKELKVSNVYRIPRPEKVVVNMGFGRAVSGEDKKEQKTNVLKHITDILSSITGQKPTQRQAKKSIAGFKLRQGDVIGMSVTLRGHRMFDFLERFLNIALPRVRDFRGLSETNIDPRGVCTIGVKEHTIFPELANEDLGRTYGVQITIVPTTRSREAAVALYTALGFPFKKTGEITEKKKKK